MASPTQLASNQDFVGVSDPSVSPQTLQTPQPYGRTRPRYPQELGRVPLHRRGTSKTYERLEDLLREAGYKETRIFTPETERTSKCDDDDDDATVVEDKRSSMVKDVVGFLAGLIPGVGVSITGPGSDSLGGKELDPSARSQTRGVNNSPPSPLVNQSSPPPLSRERPHYVDRHPTQAEHPQIVIHATTPHRYQAREHHQQLYEGPQASHRPLHPHKQHPAQHQRPHGLGLTSGSNLHLESPHTTTNVHSPRPSRATAYLRHMASAPNVIPRPNSTPGAIQHPPQSRSKLESQSGGRQQPPLPTTWLETVARAVLFGGTGAHVGGPLGSHQVENLDANHHKHRASPARQLRPSRSSLSQVSHKSRYYSHLPKKSPLSGGLSDATNFTPSTATSSAFLSPSFVPPALFAQLERGRADKCVSEVSLTRVTCRSAPGSRSGSVVRSEGIRVDVDRDRRRNVDFGRIVDMESEDRGRNRGVKRRSSAGGRRLKGRDKDKLRVPSLAKMYVEGDVWSSNLKTRKRSRPDLVPLVGSGPVLGKGKASEGEVVQYESYSDESEEEDDEEEDELNLARMLLPPKRQNSIRSLQKHLLTSDDPRGAAYAKLKHVHRPASGTKGGDGAVGGRLRRQTSQAKNLLSPNDPDEEEGDHVFWHGAHHKDNVFSTDGRGKSRNSPRPLNLAGDHEDSKRRNSCSDDEDIDSFADLFDVGKKKGSGRDPMGSGRSDTSGKRLRMWGVISGGS